MKVSEVIDQLKVGDEVWVKGVVDVVYQGLHPSINIREVGWFSKNTEISLTEPQGEKVEVPDFVAEWIEYAKKKGHTVIESAQPWDLYGAEYSKSDIWIKDNQDTFARAFMDGYTVKPKRWVVKYQNDDYFICMTVGSGFGSPSACTKAKEKAYMFDDKSKAEAVATLVEGSVEEV